MKSRKFMALHVFLSTAMIALSTVVSRATWKAREPRFKKPLKLPVSRIVIHRTNTKMCYELEECCYYIRKLQKFHIGLDNLSDIKYNFMVGSDDKVYEGRGWHLQGEHTPGLDDRSIGVAFIAKYGERPNDEDEMECVKNLILDGLSKGYISKNFKIVRHDELTDETVCPGLVIIDELRKWNKDTNKNFGVKYLESQSPLCYLCGLVPLPCLTCSVTDGLLKAQQRVTHNTLS